MQTKLVRVTTSDHLTLHGLLYTPDSPTSKIVLHIHGMGGNFYENRFLDFMSKTYTDNSYAFLSVNTRGHELVADFALSGTPTEEYRRIGVINEIFAECITDILAWMDFIEANLFSEITLQGHSLGCAKVTYYVGTTNDIRVKNVVHLSPADMIGLTEKYQYFSEMLIEAKQYVTNGQPDSVLSHQLDDWYFMSAKTFLDYAIRGNPIDVFNTYDLNTPSILSEITIPIFALFGTNHDTHITNTPEEALAIIKQKATHCPQFDTAIIPKAPHSYKDHEQVVANTVISWLKTNCRNT